MNLDDFPLSLFSVDCDGSACGSGNSGHHVHPPQTGNGIGVTVTVRNNRRIAYITTVKES